MPLSPHNPIKYGFDANSPPQVPEDEHANNVGHFTPSFDQRLWMFHRAWEPTNAAKATLMIVHGTVDHSGQYEEMATKLVKDGIAVFAMDMRGWGLSDGENLYVDDMDHFVQDVERLYQHIHTMPRYQNVKPRFLLGKSLGGTVTACAIAKYPDYWTGLIGLSGAYEVDPKHMPSSLMLGLLNAGAQVFPKIPLKKLFDEHLIVSDESALQEWRDDKLCCKDKVRLGYVVTLADTVQKLPTEVIPKINLPMLMMCGDADKVVTMSGHQLMIDKSQHQDKELKKYPGGFHNLLLEPTLKEQVMSDVKEWILAHVVN